MYVQKDLLKQRKWNLNTASQHLQTGVEKTVIFAWVEQRSLLIDVKLGFHKSIYLFGANYYSHFVAKYFPAICIASTSQLTNKRCSLSNPSSVPM